MSGSSAKKSAIIIGMLLSAGIVFLGWKFFAVSERIHIENPSARGTYENLSSILPGGEREKLRGEDEGRINILLLGRAGEKYPGKHLTDTVMLASIDTKEHRAGFLSLPRDLYAPIPGTNLYTKLNSLYQYGLSSGDDADIVRRAVEHMTGVDVPYFISLDFDGFERIIDDLGGVKIYSERDIRDTRYPGKNYSYETFELSAGWHELDGKTALKYARERHSDPEGDFGRAKRQQQIIKAAQEKAFSAKTYLNAFTITRLFETLGDSVRTNLSIAEIASLAELGKTTDLRNASTVVVDAWRKESLLRVSHVEVSGVRAFILVPRTGNWSEIREVSAHIFDQEDIRKRTEQVALEAPSILVISRPEDASKAAAFARTVKGALGSGLDVDTAISPTLEKSVKSAIMDRTSLGKPYSFDSLLRTFGLEKSAASVPTDVRNTAISKADFVILYGESPIDTPVSETTLDETDGDGAGIQDEFSDFLEPQKR